MAPVKIWTANASFPAKWDLGFNRHPEFEISVVLEGKGEFLHGDHIHALERGHVVILPSHLLHSYRAHTPIRFAVLSFSGVSDRTKQLFESLVQSQDAPRFLFLSEMDLSLYESMFRNWLKVVSRNVQDKDLLVSTWIELFILMLQQNFASQDRPLPIVNAADFIRSELHRELRMAELSAMFGFSVSNFRKVFTATFGMSPKAYQQACRLNEAKCLLRSTDKPVQLIAQQIGFSSLHFFSAWFHQRVGVAPSKWRRTQRGEL